ncbi:MAG: thioesterase family protein [Planctomycetes bacterium]|nr:thioesterase family protein [Planctomycetota bacterium]
MTAPSFVVASAVARAGPGRYAVEVDASWLQGRGAFGGLVAAWLVRAMEAELQDPARALRALGCVLCAPARPGPAEVHVRALREGLNVTFLEAELRRRDRVVARASGTFARPGPTAADGPPPAPPDVPAPGEVPAWSPPMPLPAYCQHVAHARCFGAEVLSGPGADAALGGWTWFRAPTPDDAASRVALLDAWPPALFTRLVAPRAVGTVAMACHLVGLPGPAVPPGTPLLVTARAAVTHAGASEERGELWTPDGRLLATSLQTVAVLGDQR